MARRSVQVPWESSSQGHPQTHKPLECIQFSLYFHGRNSHPKNHPTTSGSPSDWFHTRFSAHQSTEPPRPFRRCFQVELHEFGEVQPASYWIQPLVSHCFWTSCWIVGSFCTQWINSQSQLGDENLQIGSPLICAWNKCPNNYRGYNVWTLHAAKAPTLGWVDAGKIYMQSLVLYLLHILVSIYSH